MFDEPISFTSILHIDRTFYHRNCLLRTCIFILVEEEEWWLDYYQHDNVSKLFIYIPTRLPSKDTHRRSVFVNSCRPTSTVEDPSSVWDDGSAQSSVLCFRGRASIYRTDSPLGLCVHCTAVSLSFPISLIHLFFSFLQDCVCVSGPFQQVELFLRQSPYVGYRP